MTKKVMLFLMTVNFTNYAYSNILLAKNESENAQYLWNSVVSLINKATDKVSGKTSYCDALKEAYHSEEFFIKDQAPWHVCQGGWDLDRKYIGRTSDCVERQYEIYNKGLECFRVK